MKWTIFVTFNHNITQAMACTILDLSDDVLKALPFGLSTAPMEFKVVAKEVKFHALQKGIMIHQYLDDWLVRARSHESCL